MQLYAVNFIPLLRSLYMFRVFYTPIIRSTIYNCIYSHWHILVDRRRHSSIIDYEVSGELIVTLITIWWWQKLGKDWQ